MITRNPRQTNMFEAFPTPPPKTTTTNAVTVDYTSKPPGTGWGHRKITVACPMCSKASIFREGTGYDTWVHCEEIRLDHKNNPRKQTLNSCNNKAPK